MSIFFLGYIQLWREELFLTHLSLVPSSPCTNHPLPTMSLTWAGPEFIHKSRLLRSATMISGGSNTKSTFWLGCLGPLLEGFLSSPKEEHPWWLVIRSTSYHCPCLPFLSRQGDWNSSKWGPSCLFDKLGSFGLYEIPSRKPCLGLSGQMVLSYDWGACSFHPCLGQDWWAYD